MKFAIALIASITFAAATSIDTQVKSELEAAILAQEDEKPVCENKWMGKDSCVDMEWLQRCDLNTCGWWFRKDKDDKSPYFMTCEEYYLEKCKRPATWSG